MTSDVYVTAVGVGEVFADLTYQRVPDPRRIRKMADEWDRRLGGILEVSDRGEAAQPRFAVVDGQHRWAAAKLLEQSPMLVANVHTGLTVAEEAALFDKLNRQRKQTNAWDHHWKSRRAAEDPDVLAIDQVAIRNGLTVEMSPTDKCIACVAALEKVVKLGGTALLDDVLQLVVAAWAGRRDSLDAPLIHGLALVLHHLADRIDLERLGDSLCEVLPAQLRRQAVALKDLTTGTLPTLTALAVVANYNRRPGRKIDGVTNRTFGGGSVNARSARTTAPPPKPKPGPASARHIAAPAAMTVVGNPTAEKMAVPTSLPPQRLYTDAQAEAVDRMAGCSIEEVADQVGISPRTVRRIRADLGQE